MEQKKRNRNSRQIVRILKLIHFRMKWNQMQIQTDLWMKQQEYPSGEADANGFTYQYLKESDTYRLTKGTDTENVIIPYEYNGKVVSEVGERAFYGCINIKTVKAEEGADRRKNRIRIDKSAF